MQRQSLGDVTSFPYTTSASSTAQGGGGSFRLGNLQQSLVAVNNGWRSESTGVLKGGWSMLELCFLEGCNGCSGHLAGHLTHNLLDVAWCNAAVAIAW